VSAANERGHFAAGEPLGRGSELGLHRLLGQAADVVDRDELLARIGAAFAKDFVISVTTTFFRSRSRRPPSGRDRATPSVDPDQCAGDRRVQVPP